MANEATLIYETAVPLPFTVTDGTGIEKGCILVMSDPMTAAASATTVGAIVGGGLFGDHCSPVSDTTCLSSFGAGSDHIDHVATQLPYALTAAGLAGVLFVIIGIMAV